MGAPTNARIKGTALMPVLSWYADSFGKGAFASALSRMSPEVRSEFSLEDGVPHLLPSAWYDVRLAHALLDETLGAAPSTERHRIAREAARAGVTASARGIYRFMLAQLGSPELYARHIQRVWSLLHSGGTREVRIVAPGEADSDIRDWPGHHPLLCALTNETMAAVFEVMGAKQVMLRREQCISEGAPLCRTHVSWTMR